VIVKWRATPQIRAKDNFTACDAYAVSGNNHSFGTSLSQRNRFIAHFEPSVAICYCRRHLTGNCQSRSRAIEDDLNTSSNGQRGSTENCDWLLNYIRTVWQSPECVCLHKVQTRELERLTVVTATDVIIIQINYKPITVAGAILSPYLYANSFSFFLHQNSY